MTPRAARNIHLVGLMLAVACGDASPEDAAVDASMRLDSGAPRRDAAMPRESGTPAREDDASSAPVRDAAVDAAPATNTDSSSALVQLRAWLALPRAERPELDAQAFASVALTRADAETARGALWDDFATMVKETRAGEVGATTSTARTIELDGRRMRYYQRSSAKSASPSLFISMHGGGGTTAATNDQQWENQIDLGASYAPVDAIWIAPRAPEDAWNMWFLGYIDALFDRMISDMIVFEGVDPNKVYIQGYSAGGDGVYRLGPRMADRWAGAGMSAGHPGESDPLNLRNVAFALHVGGNDTAYERNTQAAQWGRMLDMLESANPGAYPHQWQVHAGLPHWMNLADKVSIPFLQGHTRDPKPKHIRWRQAEVTQSRLYWLAVDAPNRKPNTNIDARYDGQTVSLTEVSGLQSIKVRLDDTMLDLDQPITIEHDGATVFSGRVTRTIDVLHRTLQERGDPALVFCSEHDLSLQ